MVTERINHVRCKMLRKRWGRSGRSLTTEPRRLNWPARGRTRSGLQVLSCAKPRTRCRGTSSAASATGCQVSLLLRSKPPPPKSTPKRRCHRQRRAHNSLRKLRLHACAEPQEPNDNTPCRNGVVDTPLSKELFSCCVRKAMPEHMRSEYGCHAPQSLLVSEQERCSRSTHLSKAATELASRHPTSDCRLQHPFKSIPLPGCKSSCPAMTRSPTSVVLGTPPGKGRTLLNHGGRGIRATAASSLHTIGSRIGPLFDVLATPGAVLPNGAGQRSASTSTIALSLPSRSLLPTAPIRCPFLVRVHCYVSHHTLANAASSHIWWCAARPRFGGGAAPLRSMLTSPSPLLPHTCAHHNALTHETTSSRPEVGQFRREGR